MTPPNDQPNNKELRDTTELEKAEIAKIQRDVEMLEELRQQALSERDEPVEGAIDLYIEGESEPIYVAVKEHIVLGRFKEIDEDKVDLTAFFDRGVSRRHAAIHREGSTFTIMDLESKNGTYLNDERLAPHKSYPLQDGDKLSLGELDIYVYL